MEFLRAEAQLGAEQFSDKKQVWINDKDHGFAKAVVLEDNGDSYKVQKAQSNEVCVLSARHINDVLYIFFGKILEYSHTIYSPNPTFSNSI